KPTKIPLKYKEWLYVKDLNRKYGVQTVIHAENAAAKIANLPAQNSVLQNYTFVYH
ncbi:MAG: hypothetical protein JWQ06_589, partial [Mucilaginibacter sp.]|nr:hypothetical protein [Mucilaginibacter sp.]